MTTINDEQARALAQVLAENGDGTDVTLSTNHEGVLVVEFSLVTITIASDGEIERD